MANRLSDEKIKLIAQAYVANQFNRTKTLQSLGYSKTYANNAGLKLFENIRVKDATTLVMQETNKNMVYDKSKAEQLLLDLLDRCKTSNDRSNEVAVLREMNTINALRVDVVNTNDTTQQKAIDENAMLEAKRMAEIRLKQG